MLEVIREHVRDLFARQRLQQSASECVVGNVVGVVGAALGVFSVKAPQRVEVVEEIARDARRLGFESLHVRGGHVELTPGGQLPGDAEGELRLAGPRIAREKQWLVENERDVHGVDQSRIGLVLRRVIPQLMPASQLGALFRSDIIDTALVVQDAYPASRLLFSFTLRTASTNCRMWIFACPVVTQRVLSSARLESAVS